MRKWLLWISVILVAELSSCNKVNDKLNAVTTLDSQFETSVEKWSGDFAEYSEAEFTGNAKKDSLVAASYQIVFGRNRLPQALDSTKYSLKFQSFNRNNNLFTFFKKKVSGLIPNRSYKVAFEINLGTSYSGKSTDANGSPGASVYIKAGASAREPIKTLANGYYSFNLDKGKLSASGKEMVVLGDISNSADIQKYALVSRSNDDNQVLVSANTQGEIWLCVGMDSGYKGATTIYYDRIKAVIYEQNPR